VKTLDLIGVQPPSPKPKALKRLRRRLSVDTDVINVDGGSTAEGLLSLAITVPDGYHFSKVNEFTGFSVLLSVELEMSTFAHQLKLLGVTGWCRVTNIVSELDVSSSNPGGCDLSK
jgi:hypothetical protein